MIRTWIHIGNRWINLEHVAEFADREKVDYSQPHDGTYPYPPQPCLTITMMTHYMDGDSGCPIEHKFFGAERESLLEFLNGNALRAIDLTAPAEPHDEAEAEAYTDYEMYSDYSRDLSAGLSNDKYDRD